ncbi:hypothetical protein [Streptomyces flaveus]|uniref:hypothetical protein n=1 Tax=Streptomyces flaveus TaxID=66370 RepID=UPI00332A2725
MLGTRVPSAWAMAAWVSPAASRSRTRSAGMGSTVPPSTAASSESTAANSSWGWSVICAPLYLTP